MTLTAPHVIVVLLGAALLVSTVRLVLGPSLPDRVVALDLIAVSGIALMATAAIALDDVSLIDAALFLGLVSFVGTAAFATYVEREGT